MSNLADTTSTVTCSIIIPTRDQLEFLQPCVESILRSTSDLTVEIIIVDNGSTDAETLNYLATLRDKPCIKLLDWPAPFNFSAINNFAVQHASSDILCFLNNDIEIKDNTWLQKLLPLARRSDVGAVGCTLLYPDNRIQHGGIALHAKAIAKHIALKEPANFFDEQGIQSPFSVAAVTAACLLVRKSLFLRFGGFNETRLAVAFNDVDFCLRLNEKGLPVLLHPGVQLVHHESVTRKSDDLPSNRTRAQKERAYMLFRWRYRLAGQKYEQGLPAEIAAVKNLSLDERIGVATESLYLRAGTSAAGSSSSEDDVDSWQKPYQDLMTDFENLKAHTLRIEQAHRLIENSIFWRMTAPLRRLKQFITRENRRPAAVIGDASDSIASQHSTHKSMPVADPDKAGYDNRARKQLARFLQDGTVLEFPQEQQPAISIVLVFFNQAHLSLLCLQSILDQADVTYEVVVVDNNSTDDTAKLLERLNNVTVIRNTDNAGFVKAVNQGVASCRGEYVLILNNDAMLEPKTLSSALTIFESEDKVGAVGAKIKLLDGSLQEAGSIIWNDGACLGYGRGADPLSGEFQFRREVDYCSGAFLLFSREIFNELGGFDEAYAPAYYEESDFCIRLQKRGLRIIYNPQSQITHYEFASSGGLTGASKLQAAHREILCQRHAEFLASRYENNPDNALAARTNNNWPNVLVIDDRVPHPSLGAGYPRAANLLNALAGRELNISFYPLLFPEDDWHTIYHTLSPKIEVLLGHGRDGLQKFLLARQGYYDYIVVSRLHNMEFFNLTLILAPDAIEGAKIIYDAEAVTAPREFLRLQLLGKPLSDDDQHRILKEEIEQARIADAIITVSASEAATYHQLNFTSTVVIGHTISPTPTPSDYSARSGFLFVGALRDDGSPNVDSLLWFIINVLPLIEAKLPGVKVHVVGDNTAPSLATVEVDAVIFHGRMNSIVSLYDSSRVFIAPTRFAAGIPHKVHEAAAQGLPSVTTRLLAEQLQWQDGEQLLVADAARDYAEQCVRLYQQESLWQHIRAQGLEAIARDCSIANFEEQLDNLFARS